MKETNRHILKEALEHLPQYQAPALVWEKVVGTLNDLEVDEQIVLRARALPVYSPPANTWTNIEEELAKPPRKDEVIVRRLFPLRQLAIAASLLLLVAVGIYFANNQGRETMTMAYTTETTPMEDISIDWNEDEGAIREVVQAFSNSVIVETTPDADDLLMEMEELDDAKKEAEIMLERYGKDANIITQIAQIEKERTAIVKKMVELMFG